MIKSELEARQACINIIDEWIDLQKGNISDLEIMKEHVNNMPSEQFDDHFGPLFAFCIGPEISKMITKSKSAILATIETVKYINGENNMEEKDEK